MRPNVREILHECVAASREERLTFPQIVAKLMAVEVERYHLDLCRSECTYYLADADSETVKTGASHEQPAPAFSAAEVESAVRATQAGQIAYNEFCHRVLAAGCAGWHVSMLGRRVVYYGRTGETHVELFPTRK